jgi:hypothetical protein
MKSLGTDTGLLHSETGRIRPADFRPCDREVAVTFEIAPTELHKPELYILARRAEPASAPLMVLVNGRPYTVMGKYSAGGNWCRCELDGDSVRIGRNRIQIGPQPGWWLPFEPTGGQPLVRLRIDPSTAGGGSVYPQYGDPLIEQHRQEWLALLPASLQTGGPRWPWCWELAGFLALAWRYRNTRDGGVAYAPWDARIILPWGRGGTDDRGQPVIAMCVHYGVCFVQFCIAMGVPARAVVLTSRIDSFDGHFVAEVWLDEFQRWAMIDPNLHLYYRESETGRPLSVAELAESTQKPGPPLTELAEFGEGYAFQRERLEPFTRDHCLTGDVYRLWGVWARHDWIAQPDLAPPAHGSVPYAETDILWCATDESVVAKLGMFPHFLTPRQLASAPEAITSEHLSLSKSLDGGAPPQDS